MRPEEKIEKRFCEEVEMLGYKARKLEIRGEKGAPDRFVLLPFGKVLFFEFKAPNGKTSKHQDIFIDDLNTLGFEAYVVDNSYEPIQIIKRHLKEVSMHA